MRIWFRAAASSGLRRSTPSTRLVLECLEDRCLPSGAPNPIAALPHDQIHVLQDQAQQQAAIATFTLQVEQFVFSVLETFAPRAPQFQPLIAGLAAAIPAQQAAVQTLQDHSNLLNQLDDLQDQVIMLDAAGNAAAAQALQPQIAAVEQEVSAFV